jgi:hypothetical protein
VIRQLGAVLDRDNTVSDLWADTAYRSAANLALPERRGLDQQFHVWALTGLLRHAVRQRNGIAGGCPERSGDRLRSPKMRAPIVGSRASVAKEGLTTHGRDRGDVP